MKNRFILFVQFNMFYGYWQFTLGMKISPRASPKRKHRKNTQSVQGTKTMDPGTVFTGKLGSY